MTPTPRSAALELLKEAFETFKSHGRTCSTGLGSPHYDNCSAWQDLVMPFAALESLPPEAPAEPEVERLDGGHFGPDGQFIIADSLPAWTWRAGTHWYVERPRPVAGKEDLPARLRRAERNTSIEVVRELTGEAATEIERRRSELARERGGR